MNQGWGIKVMIFYISIYLPMYWYSEDGLDVGQHCLKPLWIILEAHLCQYHWLIDILEEKNKDKKHLRDEKLFISHAEI